MPGKQAGQMTATCEDQHRSRKSFAKLEPSKNDTTYFMDTSSFFVM